MTDTPRPLENVLYRASQAILDVLELYKTQYAPYSRDISLLLVYMEALQMALGEEVPQPERDLTVSRAILREEITQIFTPRCCHMTGLHDPTHFAKDPTVFCAYQLAKAFQTGMQQLGIAYERASPTPGCTWCQLEQARSSNIP